MLFCNERWAYCEAAELFNTILLLLINLDLEYLDRYNNISVKKNRISLWLVRISIFIEKYTLINVP